MKYFTKSPAEEFLKKLASVTVKQPTSLSSHYISYLTCLGAKSPNSYYAINPVCPRIISAVKK